MRREKILRLSEMPETKLITNTKVAAPAVSPPKKQMDAIEDWMLSAMTDEEQMAYLEANYTAETKKPVIDARRKKTAK